MRSFRLMLVVAALAGTFVASIPAVAIALNNGAMNGIDQPPPGTGIDDPDTPDLEGSYSVDNYLHDFYLSEWLEPSDDWVRNRWMWWNAAREQTLNNQSATKGLGTEVRIKNQDYYDFNNGVAGDKFNTNLPWTKRPENENALEEWIRGYTEVDMEIKDASKINKEVFYFWDIKVDSERIPTSSQPIFNSEIEYCDKNFDHCQYDQIGQFNKVVLQR